MFKFNFKKLFNPKKRKQEIYDYLKKSTFEEMAKVFSNEPLISTTYYNKNYLLELNVNNDPYKLYKYKNKPQIQHQINRPIGGIYDDDFYSDRGYMTPGGWVGYDGGALLTHSDGFSATSSCIYDHI